MLLGRIFKFMIRDGAIRVADSAGHLTTYGDGSAPRCTMHLHSRLLNYKLPFNPSLYFGEAYMDGLITFDEGTLADFLEVSFKNYTHLEQHPLYKLVAVVNRQRRWLRQRNPIRKACRNVAHHYDLSDQLYDLFLDRDRQYSCAYFTSPHGDLERAQEDKKRHLASKLLLDRSGLRVFDIGSGWGGLGIYLAETAGCEVTGVTLSEEQHALSQERVRQAGLDQQVRFFLHDYREDRGTYDRIVSVGMFEHVGVRHYDEFFGKVRDLLTDDGVCLLHSIGHFTPPFGSNPFIRKYVFPGGELPALSEVTAAVERSGLFVTDIEILRLHYAETLKIWHDRFQANRARVAELHDERFCRMWELYLKSAEYNFRYQDLMVFQLQLAKQIDTVPITRDYMYLREQGRDARAAHAAE
jgi:cyclopropane-fatty-acyl-phospholipid synthase